MWESCCVDLICDYLILISSSKWIEWKCVLVRLNFWLSHSIQWVVQLLWIWLNMTSGILPARLSYSIRRMNHLSCTVHSALVSAKNWYAQKISAHWKLYYRARAMLQPKVHFFKFAPPKWKFEKNWNFSARATIKIQVNAQKLSAHNLRGEQY